MVAEQQLGRQVELPLPDDETFTEFCEELYEEGLAYDKLPPGEVNKMGKHTSIVLHNYPDGTGRWASIHYRENLEQLAEIEGRLAKARKFLTNIGTDLYILAERLMGDLADVRMIYGLTDLSASWGNGHSFTTRVFTTDPGKIRIHSESITGLPSDINEQAPLKLFIIEKEAFIQEFHSEAAARRLNSRKKDHL